MSVKIDFMSQLPTEISFAILSQFDINTLNKVRSVSKNWRYLSQDTWKEKTLRASIDRWLFSFYDHLSPTVFQSSKSLSNIINESDIKQKKREVHPVSRNVYHSQNAKTNR